jgi:hypothetical protein
MLSLAPQPLSLKPRIDDLSKTVAAENVGLMVAELREVLIVRVVVLSTYVNDQGGVPVNAS